MVVKNFTPHEIHIIDPASVQSKPEIRKLVSEFPVIVEIIPSSGILNVEFEVFDGKSINGIPTRIKRRKKIDPIPGDCDIAIVSALYASLSSDIRAYTIIDPVFDVEGKRVIGCTAIGRVESI